MPCLKSTTALACYIFDYYQPILIILTGIIYKVSAIISLFSIFMPEDKMPIKNLFTLEGYNAKKVF